MTDRMPGCSCITVMSPWVLVICPQGPSPVHCQWMSPRVSATNTSSSEVLDPWIKGCSCFLLCRLHNLLHSTPEWGRAGWRRRLYCKHVSDIHVLSKSEFWVIKLIFYLNNDLPVVSSTNPHLCVRFPNDLFSHTVFLIQILNFI